MSLWKRGSWYWADFAVEGQRFRVPLETTDWREAKEREQTRIGEAREGKLAPRVPDLARMKLAEAIETYLGGLRACQHFHTSFLQLAERVRKGDSPGTSPCQLGARPPEQPTAGPGR
jgi:hypothetical protein